MALLEATNTLLDFDLLQNSVSLALSPLSPVSSTPSSDNSIVTCGLGSSDDESNMTSLVTASLEQIHYNQQLDYLNPPSGTDVSLTSSSNSSPLQDDQFMDFDIDEFASGFEMGVFSPQSENSHAESVVSPTKADDKAAKQTKEGRRRTPRPTSANNSLPPCRICADAASGFHYGVNSCEACKRFFRRALKRKRNFKCRGNKNCAIKGKKNNLCGYCRYKRCLALGMSKTAIKTGRYTHEKRAQDILEVQRLVSEDSAVVITDAEVREIVHTLMAVHAKIITNADVPDEVMAQTARQKKEEFQLKMDMFGIQDALSQETYDEVFRVTGLDVDERQKHMKFVAKSIDKFVHGYVRFGKGVPGFADLPITDQANLLKLARAEVWFLGAYRGFLQDCDVFFAPNHDCRHRCEMERLLGKEYTDCAFGLAASLRRLRLTHQEEVLLKAVCLTFGDRCALQDPGAVEAIQWKMLKCFLNLIRQNHGEDQCLFYRVMSWLASVRHLTELSRKALSNSHFSDAIRSYATLVDMILV